LDRVVERQKTYSGTRHQALGSARAEGEEMTGPRPAGRPWTLTDDDILRKLLASGMKAPAIALKMNRTIGAIQSRKSELKTKEK
jgi:hypothetical protein